jgi:MFS family permease
MTDRPIALAVGGMAALAGGLGIGRFAYTPILPAMLDALQLSASSTGLIAYANLVGDLAGALLAASPRIPGSRRKWLIAALAVNAAAMGMMGLSTSFALFVLLRFIGGLVSAFILVFASVLVLDRLSGSGRPALPALHFAGVGIGIAVSAAALAIVADFAGHYAAEVLLRLAVAVLDRGVEIVHAGADRPGNGALLVARIATHHQSADRAAAETKHRELHSSAAENPLFPLIAPRAPAARGSNNVLMGKLQSRPGTATSRQRTPTPSSDRRACASLLRQCHQPRAPETLTSQYQDQSC